MPFVSSIETVNNNLFKDYFFSLNLYSKKKVFSENFKMYYVNVNKNVIKYIQAVCILLLFLCVYVHIVNRLIYLQIIALESLMFI